MLGVLAGRSAITQAPDDPDRARNTRAARRPRSREARGAAGAKRGRPTGSGNRTKQALAEIGGQPGITASELAELMGVAPNYLYRVLPRLQKDGAITKRGRGYHLVAETDAPRPAPSAPEDT
jgi:CRP-like cAMP-binding protein